MRTQIIALCLFLLGVTSLHAETKSSESPPDAGLDAYARPHRLVRLSDGRRMNIYCLGSGSPTVILDGGIGESTLAWAKVQPALAPYTKVCAYDRAGLGFSDKGSFPRDAEHIVDDLSALLSRADIRGPYILVGHSLTGQTMRLFASRHLNDVVGIVLIDPALDHVQDRLLHASPAVVKLINGTDARSNACMKIIATGAPREQVYKTCGGAPPKIPGYSDQLNEFLAHMFLDPAFEATAMSENDNLDGVDDSQIEGGQKSFGRTPLLILTATVRHEAKTAEEREGVQAVWLADHQDLAKLSEVGRDVVVEGADHGMQYLKPDPVISAIREVIAAARDQPSTAESR